MGLHHAMDGGEISLEIDVHVSHQFDFERLNAQFLFVGRLLRGVGMRWLHGRDAFVMD
jgi:hypothetical protein